MWFFRRRPKAPLARSAMRRLVAGLIIGGAIGSIVGSKVLDKVQKEQGKDDEDTKTPDDNEKK